MEGPDLKKKKNCKCNIESMITPLEWYKFFIPLTALVWSHLI